MKPLHQTYLELFPGTNQFGQLATCGDIPADTFRIWLLDGDSTPKWVPTCPSGPLWCVTPNAILIYGPGSGHVDTWRHTWRHSGPWQDDFKALVDAARRTLRKAPNA